MDAIPFHLDGFRSTMVALLGIGQLSTWIRASSTIYKKPLHIPGDHFAGVRFVCAPFAPMGARA